MTLILAQYVLLVVVLIISVSLVRKHIGKNLSLRALLIWLLFWGCVSVVIIDPQVTQRAANLIGIGRGADLVIYLSLIIIFFLLSQLLSRQQDMERSMTKLVREIALSNPKKKDQQ